MSRTGSSASVPLVLGLSVSAGVVAWAAFLSYGNPSSYATWQVVGSAVLVLVGTILVRVVARGRHAWATIVGVTAGFAGPWGAAAGRNDDTGLFLVGLVLLVLGLLAATTLITLVTDLVLRRRTGRA